MTKTKTKIPAIIITSRESLDATIAEIVQTKLRLAELTAAMELDIAAVQERHQRHILDLEKQLAAQEAGAYVYCTAHRRNLFGDDRKSIETPLATVGFEWNPPYVEKLAKGDTEKAIAHRLASTEWGADYVIDADPTLSKKKLIADREKLSESQLATVGIRICQDEQFFIRPKSQIAADTTAQAA